MEESAEKVDKLLERLLDIIRKSGRVAKKEIELEEEAGKVLTNLEKVLEKELKNELETIIAEKRVYYTFYANELEIRVDVNRLRTNVTISAGEPTEEFSEPLTPKSARNLYTFLTLLEEGEDLIKRAEEQVSEWEKENEERERILKALKNALAPLILEDI